MTEALVSIRSLSFAWDRRQAPCLTIPAFDLAPGESVMLSGPSGSGKSTLLGLIGGVLTPQAGSLKVLDQELTTMTARARDRFRVDHVGFIFQQFNLIPYLSAQQNVLLPCRFARRRAQRAAAYTSGDGAVPASAHAHSGARADRNAAGESSADAAALALLESIGIGPRLRRRPVLELSVGEQQRVAAARALIGQPELIIADEPTSALDADAQRIFLDLLLGQCRRSSAALLFVSHDVRLAQRFQRQVALETLNRARDGA